MRKALSFVLLLAAISFFVKLPAANAQLPDSISKLSLTNQWKEAEFTVPSGEETKYLDGSLSMNLSDVPLSQALDEISSKTGVHFSYSKEVVPIERTVSVNVEKVTIAKALDQTLAGTDLSWVPMSNDQVVITELAQAQEGEGNIKGKVVDQNGNPVAFANVVIVGTTLGAAADVNGNYAVKDVPSGAHILRASAVGYRTAEANITVAAGEALSQDFTLTQDLLGMHEMVVTGTTIPVQKLNATNSISTLSPKGVDYGTATEHY